MLRQCVLDLDGAEGAGGYRDGFQRGCGTLAALDVFGRAAALDLVPVSRHLSRPDGTVSRFRI
jgi:hypothetical protein